MLRLADPRFGDDVLAAVGRVLSSGQLTQGPVVGEFEQAIAALCDVPFAIATTSATTALELALTAHDIGPDDEVLVADFTYPATGNAVIRCGADLGLVDVDPGTWCIDVELLEAAIGPRTRAVITVDVFGLPADYARIEPLLAERGVTLLCDAACSLGGAVGNRWVGSFGSASCLSFHPRKSLTTGEGGMVLTADESLAERMRRLRNHGVERHGWRSTFVEPGFNYRLSDISAAVGLAQAPGHRTTVERRRELAQTLTRYLADLGSVTPQAVPIGHRHPYQAYVVVLDDDIDRNATIVKLREAGVESTLGTYALHAEPAFAGVAKGPLPVSRMLADQSLTLPLHQRMTDRDMETITAALESAIRPTSTSMKPSS